jgi:DNA polymerase-3 subunit gamma/tau
VTDSALLDATVEAIAQRDGAALFEVIEGVVDTGHEPRRFVSDLLERLRDVIVVQSVNDAAERGLIDAPDDEVQRIVAQATLLGPAEASRAADVVSRSLSELKGATAPRLRLEIMAARLLVPAAEDSSVGALARIEHLERAIASGGVVAPASQSSKPEAIRTAEEPTAPAVKSKPAPPKISDVAPSTAAQDQEAIADGGTQIDEPAHQESVSEAPISDADEPEAAEPKAVVGDISLEGFVTMWPAVMDALSKTRVAWMLFSGSQPVSWSDGTLAVAVDSPGKVANAAASGHDEKLRAAIADVLKVNTRIDVVVATGGAAPRASSSAPVSDADPADAPSDDDENVDDVTGVDLVIRELGATQIGEIEH